MAVGKREALLASADKLLAKGKQEAALKDYLKILEENPHDILVLNRVGDLYVLLNRSGDSIPYFSRIAEHYGRDGFFLKAIAIYKKINKIDPSRLEVYSLLADLYHKQGLVPEARAQYQILADHYARQNQVNDAIGVYRKMAAADPNDIKIPVKLADLLTSAGKTDEGLMQYGVIGSMLVKRGAVDEAVAVYQKALKIRPGDLQILRDLVRSLMEQGNAPAAAQLLKTQPRNAETMTMLGEALLGANSREEARRAAEGAIAFEEGHEGARQLLARILISEREGERAFETLRPLVEKATRAGQARKAVEILAPPTAISGVPREIFEKLLELHRLTGDKEGTIGTLRQMAADAVARHDTTAAEAAYRQWFDIDPENPEVRSHMGTYVPSVPPAAAARLSTAVPIPPATPARPTIPPAPAPDLPAAAPEPPAPAEEEFLVDFDEPTEPIAPRPTVSASPLAIDWEESAAAPPAPSAPAAAKAAAEDTEWKNAVTEAEVFAKYGLVEKAVDKYRTLIRKRKDDIGVRTRYVELLAELKSPVLAQEAQALAEELRASGRPEAADRILARVGGVSRPSAAVPIPAAPQVPERATLPPPPAPLASAIEEDFEVEMPAPAPPPAPSAPPADMEFEDFGFAPAVEAPLEEIAPAPPASPPSVAPIDLEFTFDSGLGRAIEDEMAKVQAEPVPAPLPQAAPPVDEMALFSDEQNFFDLAAELEKELSEEEAPAAPMMEGEGREVSLEEIFREFKKGVEQQLSSEDYETHYNLGIAYKEMGLLDEAIGEFQIAAKDPGRAVECCSMLGLCFLEKGLAQLAIQWYQKGLENPTIRPQEKLGLLYDLAGIYEQTGDSEKAYQAFLEIYGENTNYRDVVSRVKSLEASQRR
jgi:pilus assembly protein FimV